MGCTTKNRIWMNKNGIAKFVKPEDKLYYIQDGWSYGRIPKEKRKTKTVEKIFSCNLCDFKCGNNYLLVHIKKVHNLTKQQYLNLYPNAVFHTSEFLKQRSLSTHNEMIKRWQDNKYKNKMLPILKANADNSEFKELRAKGIAQSPNRFHSEKDKKLRSKIMKDKWKTKEYRDAQHKGIMNSPKRFKTKETKEKLSKAISELWEKGVYNNLNLDKSYSYGRKYCYINKFNKQINVKSLQELRVAYFLDLSNINYNYGMKIVKKFKYIINNKVHTYTPDFEYKDMYIEVKPNGWQMCKENFNKLYAVQLQNRIFLTVYDDDVIEDFVPKINRNQFYEKSEKCIKEGKIYYEDLYNSVGDVRSNVLIN